jgi:cell division inhibitor SepF
MANAFKKMANYLGLSEEDEFSAVEETQHEVAATPARRGFRAHRSHESESERVATAQLPTYLRSASAPSVVAPAAPSVRTVAPAPVIDRIVTVQPRFYSDVRTIGEHYRNGQPVIMNLSDVEESERKRLVDFASGLVFGHYGSIEKVTTKVFLLTPPNVAVSSEDKNAAAQASFFNQS